MSTVQLILVLLGVIAVLDVFSRAIKVPMPALLVVAGVGVALITQIPRPDIDPEAIFTIFVPPLLYVAAIQTSLTELKRYLFTISLLAIGLVFATTFAVGASSHFLFPELTWPAALVLGAIVAPPDAISAIAAIRKLSIPKQVVTILEGESLVNDASALVIYQFAVNEVITSSFSIGNALTTFFLAAIGGIAIGILAGFVSQWLRHVSGRSPTVESTISLLTPFIAYLPAAKVGASGVLAVVAVGLFISQRGPRTIPAQSRLQALYMWRMISFLLEGLIFLLVGLRLPLAFEGISNHTITQLVLYGIAISMVAIIVRLIWVYPSSHLAQYLRSLVERKPIPLTPWKNTLFAGFAGIRGGDSLVIALAIPLITANGSPFPGRQLIIFITFVVIVVTLVFLGLALPLIVRLLGLRADSEEEELNAEKKARSYIEESDPISQREIQLDPRTSLERVSRQRNKLIELWERQAIDDDLMRKLQSELDHAEALLNSRIPELKKDWED